jgi:beta-glucanase (GH16 family)
MVVWDARPEDGNATKIAEQKQQSSFQVLRNFEQFDDFNANLWEKSRNRQENSYFSPKNVDISDGHAKIRIPASTSNGGEISSKADFQYGTYRASMLMPNVIGVVTGFFLYGGPTGSADEIDIEIYNDGNWQIEFTTWVHGVSTNTTKKLLGFDPTTCYHEYRIDFYQQEVGFFVDNQLIESYSSGLPTDPMKLLVNTWYPHWLSGVPPSEDEFTYIDWIQY